MAGHGQLEVIAPPVTAADVSALWLAALQRLAARVSHELKNPLNAAVINLEVVRTRAARESVEPVAIRPFADAAAGALDRVALLADALLALARPLHPPVDLHVAALPIASLFDAVAVAEGGSVRVEWPSVGGVEVRGDGNSVRLAVASALELIVAPGRAVQGRVMPTNGSWTLRFEPGTDGTPAAELANALAPAGITWRLAPDAITMRFDC